MTEIFTETRESAAYATIENYPIAAGESATYSKLQEVLDDFGVTAFMAPNKVSERLESPTVTAERKTEGICILACYEQDDNFLVIRVNSSNGTDDRRVEKDARVKAAGIV